MQSLRNTFNAFDEKEKKIKLSIFENEFGSWSESKAQTKMHLKGFPFKNKWNI